MYTHRRLSLLALFLILSSALFAAPSPVQPREKPVPPEQAYVLLDISSVANAKMAFATAATEVQVGRVPLNLVEGPLNHLSLNPIGWSAMTDEKGEYPGYMAKYDDFPKADDPTRAALRIPVCDYENAYILCTADDDPALSTDLTLRFGRFGKNGRTTYQDFHTQIPRAHEKRPQGSQIVKVIPTDTGNLYLIRLPINRVFAQDFQDHYEMHLDITTKLEVAVNLPDPYRFQLRPIADPSGVRILAITLERPSLELNIQSTEPGNVFNQPQKPTFNVIARNHFEHYREYHYEVDSVRDDGETHTQVFESFRNWGPGLRNPRIPEELILDLTEPGHYQISFKLMRGKQLVTERPTTLAILAPNTRQHWLEGPYGTWDFAGTHSTPADLDLTGSLAVKAGWRYMRSIPELGIEAFNDPALHGKGGVEALVKRQAEEGDAFVPPKRALIFHETSISGPHVTRSPDLFSSNAYTMSDKDKERFDALWEQANTIYAEMAEKFPETEIFFGNGMPHMIEEFCRRGIRKDYLKVAGNESGSFMRLPETQPTDLVANNAGIWMFRQILDHYGYQDTKVYQCFEVTYPNTNPGNLTPRTQAAYFARHIMHSLAWGIPQIRVGCVSDMGNSYAHSNWGSSGFCYAYPNVSPKPSYVAYAVLTQVLDGARFQRMIPTGSDSVYAFEFQLPDRDRLTVLWTIRGSRPVTLTMDTGFFGSREVTITQMLGRSTTENGKSIDLTISTEPTYIRTARSIASLSLGTPVYAPPAEAETPPTEIADFGNADAWQIHAEPDIELESYNFMQPRRPGNFTFTPLANLDGHDNVTKVTPNHVDGIEVQPMYTSLVLKQPVSIPGQPTELGAWVHGNSGWGRLIFELEDAKGERWISLGAEMGGEPNPWMADWMPKDKFEELKGSGKAGISDWNSNDAWGRGLINHDGWRFVALTLPGQYGQNADLYHTPRTSQWRFSAEGRVDYPLTLKRATLCLREKILYGPDFRPPIKADIALGKVLATYAPIQEVILE